MKKTKKNWKELSREELQIELRNEKKELQSARFQTINNSLKNIKSIGKIKKNIARILTELQQKELVQSETK